MNASNPVVNHTQFADCEFKTPNLCEGARTACVEVAIRSDVIAVRSTRDPEKIAIEYNRVEWAEFIRAVKAGEFDLK